MATAVRQLARTAGDPGQVRRPRFEAQSGPPDDDDRRRGGSGKVDRQLVVARGDTAEILEPAEQALNEIAPPVGCRIKGVDALPRGIVRDHRQSAALEKKLSEPLAVVSGISGAQLSRWQRPQQSDRGSPISELAGPDLDGDGASAAIADGMDFVVRPPRNQLIAGGVAPPFSATGRAVGLGGGAVDPRDVVRGDGDKRLKEARPQPSAKSAMESGGNDGRRPT